MLAVTSNFTINLESIAVLLGILVSLTILFGVLIGYTNRINGLEIKIQHFQQELIEHSNLEGHNILVEKLARSVENVNRVEKALDLHIQDYVNRKDFIQFMLGQLDQKIEHKFSRLYNSMKDVEKFLQKSNGFRVREYSDDAVDK